MPVIMLEGGSISGHLLSGKDPCLGAAGMLCTPPEEFVTSSSSPSPYQVAVSFLIALLAAAAIAIPIKSGRRCVNLSSLMLMFVHLHMP